MRRTFSPTRVIPPSQVLPNASPVVPHRGLSTGATLTALKRAEKHESETDVMVTFFAGMKHRLETVCGDMEKRLEMRFTELEERLEMRLEMRFAEFGGRIKIQEDSVERSFAEFGGRVKIQEDRVERRFAEFDERAKIQDSALIELVDKMQKFIVDTDNRFRCRQVGALEKSGNPNVLAPLHDKVHESEMERLSNSTDSTRSGTSVAKDELVRGLQSQIEMLQAETKDIESRRLNARIEVLESDINAVNDREKLRTFTGGVVQIQKNHSVVSFSAGTGRSATITRTSLTPPSEHFEDLERLAADQRGFDDRLRHLRAKIGECTWNAGS